MTQEGSILKINIYGTEYPIKSDAATDAEYIKQVAAYVDEKMREIDHNTQAKSSLKIAILAALNITDELFQEKRASETKLKEMREKLDNLTSSLEKSLKVDNLY